MGTRHRAILGVLGLLAVPPALAQSPATEPATLTVAAEARRRLPATVSDAAVSVEVHGRDLRATATALAARSNRLLDLLRAEGAERLRTEGTAFEPEVQSVRGGPDRITGYAGRTTVTFRTVPERLPILLSGALENGATGVSQSGSLPREEEVEAARAELAAEATRSALARARAVAAAAETRIGGVQRIDLDPAGDGPDGGDFEPAARMRRPAPRPVPAMGSAAGEAEVVARVIVVVRLADGGATAR